MNEPRITPDFENLTFRERSPAARPASRTPPLFWTGVSIFLLTLLAYPFYSYRVTAFLVERDAQATIEALDREMDAQVAAQRRESAERRAATEANDLDARLRSISIAGSTTIAGQRLVIVSLGRASFDEARPAICRLAERRFGEPLSGTRLRVQIHRNNAPATEAGTLVCP